MFKIFRKSRQPSHLGKWSRYWSPAGVVIMRGDGQNAIPLENPLLGGFLTQLNDEGLTQETESGYLLGWDALYAALAQPAYADLQEFLQLPPITATRPVLQSRQSLTDRDFAVIVAGWQSTDGRVTPWEMTGPILSRDGQVEMMQPEHWKLIQEVVHFAHRPDGERDDLSHRQAWGRIRACALAAQARLDDFLLRTVVLTPEKLEITLRSSDAVADDRVIEILPGFAGAPIDWLDAFDRRRDVADRYDIVTPEGIVQVLITPKVRTVLQEIKRLPGRRVAGSRAQAFILNPYATLGDDAVDVIVETQFEQARESAGLEYERFSPVIERDTAGHPQHIGLLVETARASGPTSSETLWLNNDPLSAFIDIAERALDVGYQLIGWNGYELEIQGDTPRHIEALKAALKQRRSPPPLVSYAQVHDLSGYSSRIETIGIEKPYYSPYIAKKKEGDGWFPENITPVVVYQADDASEPVVIPTDQKMIAALDKAVQNASATGEESVSQPWLPTPIPVKEAQAITKTFKEVFDEVAGGSFVPEQEHKPATNGKRGACKQLVLRANIEMLEYEERRREALAAVPAAPKVPKSIRTGFALLPHQRAGLAWMQHLYSLQETQQVRGAVLADDMGLGKTFQLLALMAYLLECEPGIDPMLVVAPVSLLENWAEEAMKFFEPGMLPILTAYGESLASLRVPRTQIDQRLQQEDGLVKFLKPNWVGDAKIVLTTYETLRDLEFSFAAQKWSVMVCDEAQRIKNPAAMVTRAAKKQQVGFKIACTGTPVENTLADIWCLFDYVQPGLLGALNDFGHRYRKPIEAKTDEEKARVEELRMRIAPQILRRLKADVATDLPAKIIVDACRRLPLSALQRNLYAHAVERFTRRNDADSPSPFKNHLGLLHYLRLICTDPRKPGLTVFKPEPTREYRRKAPKLDWLLNQLQTIKDKGEKAIVFCEFKEIQRLLRYYIETEFGYAPTIINGDTSASSKHADSRQKRIKSFQESSGFAVMILSPVAVGFGVNIQAANHVIHYTRTWNPAKEDQATDRAYRIGQKKDVYVYYPVVCADDFTTFDVKLDQLLAYKRGLADDMLNGAGDVSPSDFNLVDVVPTASQGSVDERVDLDMALRMDWQHFECLAAVLWGKRGYECYRTPASNDHGVDVVALQGAKGQLLQVKSSGTCGNRLNWEAVKDVVTGEAYYKRRHPTVAFEKVCLTNQYFNDKAHEHAALNSVELLDQSRLDELLREHPVTMLEVERMLYCEWQTTDMKQTMTGNDA